MPSPYRRGLLFRILRIAAICLVIGIALYIILGNVFAIRTIAVEGNSFVSAEEVIATSGIEKGQNLLTLGGDRVKTKINAHRYLQYVGLRRGYPDTVTIMVTEYAPQAKMKWMGELILLGDNGLVLEQNAQIDRVVDVPEIIGMTISAVSVGQPVLYSVAGQGDSIDLLLAAMKKQQLDSEVLQINVASPDNIILLLKGNLQAILGSDEMLDEKLTHIRNVLPGVRAYGSTDGGVLNVTTGTVVDYSPP